MSGGDLDVAQVDARVEPHQGTADLEPSPRGSLRIDRMAATIIRSSAFECVVASPPCQARTTSRASVTVMPVRGLNRGER